MNLITLISWFFIVTTALSAVVILFSKNVFKAALMLLICLLSIAALYILANAEFIGVTQILIYAGGILVLVLFGIMLTSKLSGKPLKVSNDNLFSATLMGATVFGMLVLFFQNYLVLNEVTLPSQSVQNIGISLMTDFSLPFELAGILLLVALIGAAVITSFMKLKKP